jgi:DNA (cytosine-5)-methyltransferase 1
MNDPRARTLREYIRVLEETLPRAFLLENVPGLSTDKDADGLAFIRRRIERINSRCKVSYALTVGVLNAADFGVPQLRKRLFVIGSRDGDDFAFPSGSFSSPDALRAQTDFFDEMKSRAASMTALEPYFNCWDAIGDLADDDDPSLEITGKWSALIPSIPEGCNYLHHTARGQGQPLFGYRTRYWNFLLKLSKRSPSWTVAASPGPSAGPFHWLNRRLSQRELLRLQTFPDGFRVIGPWRSAQRQIGNAVPSLLAEQLALEIRRQFFADRLSPARVSRLLPKRRGVLPSPEPVKRAPRKFSVLIGKHASHPGTGLGPRARKRAT